MKQKYVNTIIQRQNTHATCVYILTEFQFNFELIRPPPLTSLHFTFANFTEQGLIAGMKTAIFLCPHDIFCRGLLLLHYTMFGSNATYLYNLTGEHGIMFTSPVIVISKGRHERFT